LFEDLMQAAVDCEMSFRSRIGTRESLRRTGLGPAPANAECHQGFEVMISAAYRAAAAKSVASAKGEEGAEKIIDYQRFREDPGLAAALMRNRDLTSDLPQGFFARQNETEHLARRFACLHGVSDVVEPLLTRAGQLAAWTTLSKPGALQKLAAARIR